MLQGGAALHPVGPGVDSVSVLQGVRGSHGPRLLQLAVGAGAAAAGGGHRRALQAHQAHDRLLQHPGGGQRPRPAQRHHRPAHQLHHRGTLGTTSNLLCSYLIKMISSCIHTSSKGPTHVFITPHVFMPHQDDLLMYSYLINSTSSCIHTSSTAPPHVFISPHVFIPHQEDLFMYSYLLVSECSRCSECSERSDFSRCSE